MGTFRSVAILELFPNHEKIFKGIHAYVDEGYNVKLYFNYPYNSKDSIKELSETLRNAFDLKEDVKFLPDTISDKHHRGGKQHSRQFILIWKPFDLKSIPEYSNLKLSCYLIPKSKTYSDLILFLESLIEIITPC